MSVSFSAFAPVASLDPLTDSLGDRRAEGEVVQRAHRIVMLFPLFQDGRFGMSSAIVSKRIALALFYLSLKCSGLAEVGLQSYLVLAQQTLGPLHPASSGQSSSSCCHPRTPSPSTACLALFFFESSAEMPQQDRSSQSTQGGVPFVARNALPSRFSASTVASSGPSRSSKSSQQLAVGVASFSPGPRPSFSTSRRASLASSAPSNLPAVAEDRTLVVPPPVPSLPTPHRTSRPGTFGSPPRDLTLVEAALSGDMEAARVALARGETPGKRDSEGRDALMGCVAGWAVLK